MNKGFTKKNTLHWRIQCFRQSFCEHLTLIAYVCKQIMCNNGIRSRGLFSLDFIWKQINGVRHDSVFSHSSLTSKTTNMAHGNLGSLVDDQLKDHSIRLWICYAWSADFSIIIVIDVSKNFVRNFSNSACIIIIVGSFLALNFLWKLHIAVPKLWYWWWN